MDAALATTRGSLLAEPVASQLRLIAHAAGQGNPVAADALLEALRRLTIDQLETGDAARAVRALDPRRFVVALLILRGAGSVVEQERRRQLALDWTSGRTQRAVAA